MNACDLCGKKRVTRAVWSLGIDVCQECEDELNQTQNGDPK